MSLPAGARLGPYEIVSPLGSGGMGDVFVAQDTRLDRRVALKILRPELADEPGSRARFEREAQAVAALSHPHICTLYDVGHQDGRAFLVMELLDGETLAGRLARGPLPLADLLEVAGRIADALDCAHRQGIVHRDLKPGNIMLTRSGPKLLDFGLARRGGRADEGPDGRTRSALTEEGVLLGTAPYMAPEQVEGRAVDARTDLFAFGVVVYEMATGRRPFEASSTAGLVGAILHAEPPPLSARVANVPGGLDRLVAICLAKNPDDRWSSAHDVRLLLGEIEAGTPDSPAAPRPARGRLRERVAWLVAAAAVTAAVALAVGLDRRPGTPAPDYLSVLPLPGTSLAAGEAPAISPDGRHVAFTATDTAGRTLLHVRDRASSTAAALPDTDEATLPFWAPDGDRIGFFARGVLKTTRVSGGRPQTLASAPVPRGGAWSRDDVILFVPFPNQLPRWVPAGGGTTSPVPVESQDPELRWFPSFLPDGRHYLFLSIDADKRHGRAIRVAALDSTDTTELFPSTASAVYTEAGFVLFRSQTSLVAYRFDAARLALSGQPAVVAQEVGFSPISRQGFFSVSRDGTVALVESGTGGSLVWLDADGRRLSTVGSPGLYNSLCLSADGTRVVYDLAGAATGNVDVWSLDLASGSAARLTSGEATEFLPACSPAGHDVIYSLLGQGLRLLRDGVSAPSRASSLPPTPSIRIPTDWSRDGRWLVFSIYEPETSMDIWVLPLTGDGDPFPVAATDAEERNGRLSPDGRWLAYTLREGESAEVYVQPFPVTGARWQVSRGGGQNPVWGPDGRELFYLASGRTLVAAPVRATASGFGVGAPRTIAELRVGGWERNAQGSPFAVTPDGRRILVSSAHDEVTPVTLVVHQLPAAGR